MDMDMSSFMDWIGLDGYTYIRIHTCFSVYNYKAKGTEDAFKFQCLPVNRNLFPPLGNLTPGDAESELKPQLSRVPFRLHGPVCTAFVSIDVFLISVFRPVVRSFFSQVKQHSDRAEMSPLHQT